MKQILLNTCMIKQVSLDEAFEEFQKSNKAKNLSSFTISFYEETLKYFR